MTSMFSRLSRMQRSWLLAGVLALVLLGEFAAHIRSAGFVYEDDRFVVAQEGGAALHLGPFTTRQLTAASWYLAPTPPAAHAMNLILHGVAIALLWTLIVRMADSVALAWAVASIYALSPMQIEPVAYAVGRGDLIATIGVLIACHAGLFYQRRWLDGGERWMILIWIGLAIGISGKESAIAGIALVPLVLRRGWLTLLMTIALAVVVFAVAWRWFGVGDAEVGVAQLSWPALQLTAWHRLWLASTLPGPWMQAPDFDYAILASAWRVEACALFAGAAALAVWCWQEWPMLAIGIGWTVLAFVPRLLVQTPLNVSPEHQWYLPMVGVSLCLGSLIVGAKGSQYAD